MNAQISNPTEGIQIPTTSRILQGSRLKVAELNAYEHLLQDFNAAWSKRQEILSNVPFNEGKAIECFRDACLAVFERSPILDAMIRMLTEESFRKISNSCGDSIRSFVAFMQSISIQLIVKKPPNSPAVIERNVIQNAFESEYREFVPSAVERFGRKFMNDFGKTWKFNGYNAPYTSLIQSSGCGKSRFMKEVARKYFVIYICLRPVDSTGYPPRSNIASQFIDPLTDGKAKKLLLASLKVLNDRIAENSSYAPDDLRKELLPELNDFSTESDYESFPRDGSSFWKKLSTPLQVVQAGELGALKNKAVCFAFDEARSLLSHEKDMKNNFRLLRRALDSVGAECHDVGPVVTAIFADTNSKVANFAPPLHRDPSLRDSPQANNLYSPIWTFPGWNPIDNADVDWELEGTEDTRFLVTDAAHLQGIYNIGRPLWTLLDIYTQTKLAITKMNGGSWFDPLNSNSCNDYAVIGCLSLRLCLFINGSDLVATELVSGYMAINLCVQETRDYLVIAYPYEPVLLYAAHYMLTRIPFQKKMKSLIDHVSSGAVLRGYRGELLSRFLMTCCFEKCIEAQFGGFYIPAVKVKDYILAMYGSKFVECLEESTKYQSRASLDEQPTIETDETRQKSLQSLLNGFIRIGKWIKLKSSFAFDDARKYYHMGIAIICHENAKGIDHAIPICIAQGKYSWIFVQDRNYSGSDEKVKMANVTCSVPSFMGDAAPSQPYLSVYHQFGDKKVETKSEFEGLLKTRALERNSSKRRRTEDDYEKQAIDEKYPTVVDHDYRFVVSVSGLDVLSFPIIKTLSDSNSLEKNIEQLKILRDGTFLFRENGVVDMANFSRCLLKNEFFGSFESRAPETD